MSSSIPLLDPLTLPVVGWLAGALALALVAYRIGRAIGQRRRLVRAHQGSLRSLAGKTAEQWAPFLDGFPGRPSEARFLGAPIDFVVFRGLGRGEVDEIVFVEVKSGRGQLSPTERAVRDCVLEGRVSWAEHRVPPPGA